MKIRLIGDHSEYHCGSEAAFRAIWEEVRRHGNIVGAEGDYDLLVVNGEGSMHHDSKGCQRKMEEVRKAQSEGRRVALVNTVWQDNPSAYADVLAGCEQVIVREVCSARALSEVGISAQVSLDAAFSCEVEDVEPVDFEGAVLVTDFFSQEFNTFVKITGKWADKFVYIDLRDWSWSHLVRSMSTASLLITGRHHAVYAACKARLPFVALEGNTHKIRGLVETASSDIPIFRHFSELRENLSWPQTHMDRYERLFDWMDKQPSWRLVF